MSEIKIDMQRITLMDAREALAELQKRRLVFSLADLNRPGPHQLDYMWAVAYVMARRENPAVTWEQIGDQVLQDLGLGSKPVPPTSASGSEPRRP